MKNYFHFIFLRHSIPGKVVLAKRPLIVIIGVLVILIKLEKQRQFKQLLLKKPKNTDITGNKIKKCLTFGFCYVRKDLR
jgi:EamA domain-containing membrane protein RarD